MNDKDVSEFNSAVRMSGFYETNKNELQSFPKIAGGFDALNADVAALAATGAARASADGTRSNGTVDKVAANVELYDLVRRIARTARTIKIAEPDFDNKFKVSRDRLGSQNLLALAAAFRIDYAAVAAKFVEYGLPATMPDLLGDKITQFEAARAKQNKGAGDSAAATAQTRAVMQNLRQTRRMLQTIVANIYSDNAAKLAEWQSACHIKKPDAPKKPAPPPLEMMN